MSRSNFSSTSEPCPNACTMLSFPAGAPSVLKKVELPIVRNEMCQSSLKTTSLGSFFQLHRSFICAGGETGVNACKVGREVFGRVLFQINPVYLSLVCSFPFSGNSNE